MNILNKISKVITKYIWAVIIVFSAIAFFNPEYFKWILRHTALLLGIAMFGMGTTIKTSYFKKIFIRPKEMLVGCFAQYTIMPVLAWLLATVFRLEADLALGVILVGCCPGGTASNVITHIAKGDVALSVGMTITSTLLAPLFTPALVYILAGTWVEVSFVAMLKTVITIILIPVLLGIAANHFGGKSMEKISSVLPLISSVAIVTLIAGIMAANSEKILTSGFSVLIIVVLHNLLGLLLGFSLAKLVKMRYEKVTAVAIEVAMQNSGLAISLAAINFAANPLATLPGAIFSVWHNMSGSAFAGIRRLTEDKDSVDIKNYSQELRS